MKAKEYTFDASYQPQVRTKTDTSRIMLDVIIALVPAMAFGAYISSALRFWLFWQ